LAQLRVVEAPAEISREHGLRRVVVEANIRGRDLGGFVDAAQAQLAPLRAALPAGYFLKLGGQFEHQQRAMQQLAVVVPLALLLIVGLLYLALRSFGSALLGLLNLPFALVGGVLAAVIFGLHLSVSAAVASIVLLGIAVQNGVLLVALFQQLRSQGRSLAETIREGCTRRFRPLVMTALTTFIGYSPMLYASGAGAHIQRPAGGGGDGRRRDQYAPHAVGAAGRLRLGGSAGSDQSGRRQRNAVAQAVTLAPPAQPSPPAQASLGEQLTQLLAGVVHASPDRALGDAKQGSDLRGGPLLHLAQHERDALVSGQSIQGAEQGAGELLPPALSFRVGSALRGLSGEALSRCVTAAPRP
jgi:hypothetical protein